MITFLLASVCILAGTLAACFWLLVVVVKQHNRSVEAINLLTERLVELEDKTWPVVESYHYRLKALNQLAKQ